jgi:uncharacterized protein
VRVIITGGSGFIGQALTEELRAAGHEVIVLSRDPARASGGMPGVRFERWDTRTAEGWGYLVNAESAIINLAGENLSAGRWTDDLKRRVLSSRIDAGRAVVQAVADAAEKPRVVIQSSAVGYYGIRRDEDTTEESAPGNDFLANVCVKWESATAPVEKHGVRRAIIRTGIPLSPVGGVLARFLLPFRFFVGGPLGSGRQPFPWIHMADQIAAIRFLLENDKASGPFNLSAPNPATNAEFARALGRAMGRPALMPVPSIALRIMFGEMASVILDGQRVVPRRLLESGFTFRFPDLEPALRDLLQKRG